MTESTSFRAPEIGVLIFALLCVCDAYRRGGPWLSTLLWGVVAGFCVELAIVRVGDRSIPYYTYDTEHFVSLFGIPACVSVGWGLVLYVSLWTARQWSDQPLKQALIAGGLAVNIDFSLEGVAQRLGFWVWSWPDGAPRERIDFFGVPYDNFTGWFGVVSLFALCMGWGLRFSDRLPGEHWAKRAARWVVAPLSAMLTIATLALFRAPVVALYEVLGSDGTGHVAILGGLLLASLGALASSRPKLSQNPIVLALVFCFQLYALAMVLGHPALADASGLKRIVAINVVLGIGIHLVPVGSRLRNGVPHVLSQAHAAVGPPESDSGAS
jgi:uncharacterized membrane protein